MIYIYIYTYIHIHTYTHTHTHTHKMEYYSVIVWRLLKKLKIELPYDPAILLLCIYPEKTVI